jgi:hypothetical protein
MPHKTEIFLNCYLQTKTVEKTNEKSKYLYKKLQKNNNTFSCKGKVSTILATGAF